MSRKTTLALWISLVAVLVLLPDSVLAQGAKPLDFIGENARGQFGFSLHDILLKLGAVNTFFHILILIVLRFAEYLLQADFFVNPNMMQALNKIWQLSRDIMNVLFAIMLIGTAIYTIITAKKDFVMSKISHFVIAVILVNFSWFFPRVILDVANILTSTIYTIPRALGGPTCRSFAPDGTPEPCKILFDVTLFGTQADHAKFCAKFPGDTCQCQTGLGCYVLKDFDKVVGGAVPQRHVMINGLVINFIKILSLTRIPDTIAGPGPVGAREGFFINLQILMSIMTVVLIQLATLLPLIGLVVGLFLRIIIIWVTVAFMPFVFLGYVKDGKIGTAIFGFETDLWKEFLNAAFLPALVALPITIGFIMLTAVVSVPPPTDLPMTMNIPLIFGVKTWWAMLWMIAAVGILWKGAFAALSKSKLIGSFTDKIKGFGEYIGGAAMQLPLLTPIPFAGKGMSLGQLVHLPKIAADTVRLKASGRTSKSLGELFRDATGRNQADIDRQAAALAKNVEHQKEIVNELRKIKERPAEKGAAITLIANRIGMSTTDPKQVLERLKQIVQTGQTPELQKDIALIEELLRKEMEGGGAGGAAPAGGAPPGPAPIVGGAPPGGSGAGGGPTPGGRAPGT